MRIMGMGMGTEVNVLPLLLRERVGEGGANRSVPAAFTPPPNPLPQAEGESFLPVLRFRGTEWCA
jgi:hypothetical protein